MAYAAYGQRERSRSRGRSAASSRSSSISSTHRLNMDDSFPPVQRWNGQTREATDWNSLRRDPEIWHPQGNCLVYLFERGASRRGPSFRIPYDFLLYSSCRPLIDHSMTAGLQTSLYHPGSATPPSYDNLSDTLSHESSYCSLHLDAPSDMSRIERFNYHITTRNFFAWLVGAPLVGPDPVSALLDLKVRMDIWRDAGADNFGSLFQYVQEQSYGDFEDLEIQMGKRLDGETMDRPQPYRNVSQTLEQQKEEKRGRRTSISSISHVIRSGSQRLKKKVSRTFSRTRGQSETRKTPSPTDGLPPVPTLSRDVHKIMQPQIRTQSPPQLAQTLQDGPGPEAETAKPKKRESSLTRFARRRLSWAAGPLRSDVDSEPMEMDSGMIEHVPQVPATTPGTSPPTPAHELTALPTRTPPASASASASRSHLSLLTRDLDTPALPPHVPMRSARRPSNGDISHVDTVNNVAFSPTSRNDSRVSLRDLSICACCGKPRKPPADAEAAGAPLHQEHARATRGGNAYSEIVVPNYANGVPRPSHVRRSSAQRNRNRHSSSHSFVSRSSSFAPTPPGLDYGSGSAEDFSGPVSPISREGSVDVGPRGRRSISPPLLLGVNGMGGGVVVGSPASTKSMDQMIWQLGSGEGKGHPQGHGYSQSREGTSGSDGSNESGSSGESEVKRGKKRASVDSTTLGAAGYHRETTVTPTETEYEQASGMDMIRMKRGSGLFGGDETLDLSLNSHFGEMGAGREVSELPA